MILSRRHLIPVADLHLWPGWTLIYTCPGGWRVEGEAAVVEWRAQ